MFEFILLRHCLFLFLSINLDITSSLQNLIGIDRWKLYVQDLRIYFHAVHTRVNMHLHSRSLHLLLNQLISTVAASLCKCELLVIQISVFVTIEPPSKPPNSL